MAERTGRVSTVDAGGASRPSNGKGAAKSAGKGAPSSARSAGRNGSGSSTATAKARSKGRRGNGSGPATNGRRPVQGSTSGARADGPANGAAAGTATGTRPGRTRAAAQKKRPFDRLAARPDIAGPRIRVGVLWFFVAMAAATAGALWSAILWGGIAAVAAREVLLAWDATPTSERPVVVGPVVWLVSVLAALPPLAAAVGTGTSGLVLVLVTLAAAGIAAACRDGRPGRSAVIAVVLPAVPATAVVVAVGTQLWAGLFLILAVSLYDAGNFVGGAESSSRVEGPITGLVGVLAVTFTMAMFQAAPFDSSTAWIAGGIVAVACPIGQWVTSALLPAADSSANAMRRLDAYVLAAPLFLAAAWAVA